MFSFLGTVLSIIASVIGLLGGPFVLLEYGGILVFVFGFILVASGLTYVVFQMKQTAKELTRPTLDKRLTGSNTEAEGPGARECTRDPFREAPGALSG